LGKHLDCLNKNYKKLEKAKNSEKEYKEIQNKITRELLPQLKRPMLAGRWKQKTKTRDTGEEDTEEEEGGEEEEEEGGEEEEVGEEGGEEKEGEEEEEWTAFDFTQTQKHVIVICISELTKIYMSDVKEEIIKFATQLISANSKSSINFVFAADNVRSEKYVKINPKP